MKHPARLLLFISLQICLTRLCYCSLAALSIDLGHQYMKIALVKPGVPMEIVLNRESHRKTDAQIYIRKDERSFGDTAFNMRVRFPENVYGYLLDLLGKKFDHPLVHLYRQRFPYYKLVPDKNRGTVCFENAEGVVYSVEELVGMIIEDARKFASIYAEQEVKDAVITVSVYFNQAERRALVEAAEIGGVNLLQLMNDNTAAGLNYGMFRRTEFNETSTKILIYDMGAMSTTATVYDFVVIKDPVTNEKNPQMSVIGVGYDRTLGGLEISMRLRDRLAQRFMDTHPNLKIDLAKKSRSMNKLLKEAERVKKVLSANPEHVAQIESFEEHDLRIPVSRNEVEELMSDLISRVKDPLNRALEMAGLKIKDVDHVILMGGGTRFPKIKEAIEQAADGKDLKNYLNTDEAIAMGAVYQAAHRSKAFKVKKFVVKDLNLYPLVVDFEKNSAASQGQGGADTNLVMRRTLFSSKSQYPQKRKMTFSKHMHDFEFRVNYGDLTFLQQQQIEQFGGVNISRVFLSGVKDAVQKHLNEEGSVFKGAKAHFRMDESGILQLESADISFEKNGSAGDGPSAFQRIGQSISSFFGSNSDKDKPADAADNKTSSQEPSQTTEEAKKGEAKAENTTDINNDTSAKQSLSNETASVQPTVAKPKIVVTDLPLTIEKSFMDLTPIDKDHMKESAEKLKTFDTLEANRLALAKVKNDLESEVLDIKYKILDDPVYQKVSSQQEQDKITQKCTEISDWLDEQGVETPKKEYEVKLAEIRALTKDISYKVKEATERVKAVESLTQMLNHSRIFVEGMKNFTTGDSAIFTEVEFNTLEKLLNETQAWFDEKQSQQAKIADHELPVLTVQSVAEKWLALDREVKYLINKAKFAAPKSKTSDKQQQQQTNHSNTTSGNQTTTEEDQSKQDKAPSEEPTKDNVEIPETTSNESGNASESDRPKSDSQKDETSPDNSGRTEL